MTIAIICDVLGKANNGTTIAAMNLINAMKERGHTVRVVCPDEERRGMPGWYVVPRCHFGPFQKYMEANGVAPAKLDRRILEAALQDADIIHVILPFALGKAAARYAAAHRIPLTAGFHCQAENITSHLSLQNIRSVNRWVYRILNRRMYRFCDCIHFPTQFICDVFEKTVGPTPHRVISNGVDRAFRPGSGLPAERMFTVLFIKQSEYQAALDGYTFSKDPDEDNYMKGIMWQILTGSGSTKNNPYSKGAGQVVLDSKSGGGGGGSGNYAPARLPTMRLPTLSMEDMAEARSGLELPSLEERADGSDNWSGLVLPW